MKRVMFSFAVASLLFGALGVTPLVGNESAADVGGTWEMLSKGPQGDFTGDLVLRQDGGAIHGTVGTDFGEGPVEGKVKGTAIQFDARLAMEEGTINVHYSGVVSGDGMKGMFKAADTKGTWSAVRQHSGQ